MRWILWFLMIPAFFVIATTAQASNRDQKKFGLWADYDVGTRLMGANLGLNATDWVRLDLGYATTVVGTKKFDAQLQGDAKFFIPQWDFSPYAGLGSGPASGTLALLIGLDYTSSSGWNVGAGYSQVTTSGASGTVIYLGYYF